MDGTGDQIMAAYRTLCVDNVGTKKNFDDPRSFKHTVSVEFADQNCGVKEFAKQLLLKLFNLQCTFYADQEL